MPAVPKTWAARVAAQDAKPKPKAKKAKAKKADE